MATEYKDRVSVRKEILMKIQSYIEFGCYEQAVEMLDDLCDDNERRKAQERKKTLYFKARKAETPEEKKRAWAAYYSDEAVTMIYAMANSIRRFPKKKLDKC